MSPFRGIGAGARSFPSPRAPLATVIALALAGLGAQTCRGRRGDAATLQISIVDADARRPTPARVELLDGTGRAHVAEDALAVGALGTVALDGKGPWRGSPEEWQKLFYREIPNPFAGTTQFYSTGRSTFTLPAGSYRLRIEKGIEYRVESREIRLVKGEAAALTVSLSRWVDLPRRGWYGADDHLHIARPFKKLDPLLSKWMQAEDIHVANLLQWGHAWHFHNAVQYEHGSAGVYQEGDYLLAPGQENPRVFFLGHAIILGARSPINFPASYPVYRFPFMEARKLGALAGYAHAGRGRGGFEERAYGLALDLGDNLLDFIEVLQFRKGGYGFWYDALNSGFRIAPTAGTDYMNPGKTLPGRDRFYTRVDAPLTYEAWLEGLRRGRTFVTNGPALEFQVNDHGMGDEIVLAAPQKVDVRGRVLFDPTRDDVRQVEVVRNGEVIHTVLPGGKRGEIAFRHEVDARQTAWLALRVSGEKVGEAIASPSEAHSGTVLVTVAGTPPLAAQPRAQALARTWIERLDALGDLLREENLAKLAAARRPDGIDEGPLRRNRAGLLAAIQVARKRYADLAAHAPPRLGP